MRSLFLFGLAAATACVTWTTQLKAGVLPRITVESGQLPAADVPRTIALDVWLGGLGSASIDLAEYQLQLTVVGPDELLTIRDFGPPATHPYLFEPESTLPTGLLAADGSSLGLRDLVDSPLSLSEGDGFANLNLQAAPGAAGEYLIEISIDPNESFLARGPDDFVLFDVAHGRVTIVPEPAAWLASVLLTGGLLAGGRLRPGA